MSAADTDREDFTLDAYRRLLEALRGRGYAARGFADADPGERHVILRHDLDMSIGAALPIAGIERELGVRATYFVLVRTEMYNPFSRRAQALLGEIAGLGHEIGLHLDASPYGDDLAALDAAAAAECRVLETIIGRPVAVISFHRPAGALLGLEAEMAGRMHAYQPRFFRDMGYCADSRGAWRHGHPLEHPALAEGRAIQLLTHPIWWTGAAGAPEQRLTRFLEDRFRFLDNELAAQCAAHKAEQRTKEDK